jgi:hypothetical protein
MSSYQEYHVCYARGPAFETFDVPCLFGFESPPLAMLVGTGIIVIVYLVSAELLKPLAVRSRH